MLKAKTNEGPSGTWTEPFAGMYARIKWPTYIIVMLVGGLLVQGYWLYVLGTKAAAHVFEITPDGEARYVGDREANLAPRESEAKWVAKQFVERLYGWNSSTVHKDIAEAINLCAGAMVEQFRKELADVGYITTIRKRQIRSEVSFKEVAVVEHKKSLSRVRVTGKADIFPINEYEGAALESKPFDVEIIMSAVPREPETRPNGLEIVRIIRHVEEPKPEELKQ